MDVRFSNVVEVTRQFFQGVPPGVSSGPPAGQAPAQRPPNYWAGASSQAPYPPVSSAPSPLPYPNQQQPNRLPSMGGFTTSSQQRTTSVLPSMSQIKQGISVQEYPSGYPSRVQSGYKYVTDQQAGAALYNTALSQRQSVSPRTQSSANGTPSSHASQQTYLQSQGSSQSYYVQPNQLHQQLSDAAKQLSHLQASQGGHLSSGHQSSTQSHTAHPRQSPLHSSHQQMLANQHLLNNHLQHSQHHPHNSSQELPRRSPVSHQAAAQLLQAQRQQSLSHSQQQTTVPNHVGSHLHQQVPHRQQSSTQQSSHRMPSPAPNHSVLSSHHISNHSSQLGVQYSHHQSVQSSSLVMKSQSTSHQQSYSQTSAQQMQHHQLMSHLQQTHQSVNAQSQTHIQSSYHQHMSGPNPSTSNSSHRLTSPSSHHQASPSVNQHHMNVLQQHRSTHAAQTFNPPTASNQTSLNQTSYLTSSSSQNSFSQNYISNTSSRILSQLTSSNSNANVATLSNLSPSLSRSRDNLSSSNHSSLNNINTISGGSRETSHSLNHINITSLVNNSIREGVKTNLPSIANLMNASQHHQVSPLSSRSSTLSQTSPVLPRKTGSMLQPSAIVHLHGASQPGDTSGVLNLSDGQSHQGVNLASPSPSQSVPNPVVTPSHRSIVSGVVKRESPLDLSVKTIRQSADSTATDEEYMNFVYNHHPDFFQRKTPPQPSPYASNSSPFEGARSSNKPVSAPKVDFTPDFSSSAYVLPKKKKSAEVQQYVNSLPSIGSFAKPQLPRSRAEHFPYYQSGPSTSNVASYPQGHQVYPDVQKTAPTYPPAVKRPPEEPMSGAPPPKTPRTDDTWRQTIDRQIENKLNSYLSSKTLNGERTFESSQSFRFPQYPQPPSKPPEKPAGNGQADKRVLDILRTSLETREARNKAPPTNPVLPPAPVPDHPPKVPVVVPSVRQNLPPFGAIGTYPKDVISPLDTKPVEIVDITDDAEDVEPKKTATNGTAINGELDGLAAFLAARIRTKAELKQQVDPGGTNRFNATSVLTTAPPPNQNVITPRVFKTEEEADSSLRQTVKTQTTAVSPPKLTKEHGVTVNIPRKRDSDSESEMPPVLERQRKSSQAAVQTITHTHVVTHVQLTTVPASLPDPPTPPVIKEEDLPEEEKDWLRRCDELISQLQSSSSSSSKKKKRLKKKRYKIQRLKEEPPEIDGGLTKQESIEAIPPCTVTIKQELEDIETEVNELRSDHIEMVPDEDSESDKESEVAWQRRGNMLVRKKKPLGDGSHFAPGWQDEVYRYKQSLRMPDSLISIARPTSSLPDLQNYMDSPAGGDTTTGCETTPESTPTKQTRPDDLAQSLNQEKTILDKLMERFKLNRTEPEAHDSKNPYMDYLNKERNKVRGRSQSRKFIKKKATFKEIFGEERPASAPPAGIRENDRKKPSPKTKVILRSMLKLRSKRNLRDRQPTLNIKPKKRRGPRPKIEREKPLDNNTTVIQTAIPPIVGDKPQEPRKPKTVKRKGKSSGFDYIKKKKKINKDQGDGERKPKKKKCVPMTIDEIKEELKTWILNKDSGETNLQRAARLGYTEVVQYCLSELKEKATCKDSAGFTPLHEAASQGHIDIAKLLLDNGANVNEPAQDGIRPLHEAAENGFTDLMDVLMRFGANPDLTTCHGQTAFSLATDERARRIIDQYRTIKPVELLPPPIIQEKIFEPFDDDDAIDGFEIEESDIILPTLYRLSGEPRSSSWILYHELAPLVRAKTKDSLLRRLGASIQQDTRDLKPSDFYVRARMRTLVMGDTERKPPKLGTKMSRVTLIRYTQAVKLLLDVETTIIPR